MHLLKYTYVILSFIMFIECSDVKFETLSTVYIPYTYSPDPQYALDKDAAEQMAYDADSRLIYTIGDINIHVITGDINIHVIDISNVSNPKVLFHTSFDNVVLTNVAVCGGHVFLAFNNLRVREDGFVEVFKAFNKSSGSLDLVHHITVGNDPDRIHPVKDCSKVLVNIEADPFIDEDNDRLVDNPGGVGIITFANSPSGPYSYKVVEFGKFDARYAELEETGVRWIYKRDNNALFSTDIEPEYITFNSDETKAYICLQENNAIAVIDMDTELFEEIYGLGFKNWMDFTMDASDQDGGIHMQSWPVYGMYQPHVIKHCTHNGIDYLIMANEGESKDYEPYFIEEVRVEDVVLSKIFGRLKITTQNGKNPETGEYDKLYTFGGRSFSIRRADTMELVYDSGSEIEEKTALLSPNIFNSDYEEETTVESRVDSSSDNTGPGTASLAIGYFGDTTLIMVGNGNPGSIAVYKIDERIHNIAPTFVTLITGIPRTNDTWDNMYSKSEISMLDPEDMRFIQAEESPNGKPLLLVCGSTSGTISVIEVSITHQAEDPNNAPVLRLSKVLVVSYFVSFLLQR